MTLSTLTTSIENIIQDTSVTDLVTRINDCVSMIAAGIRMSDGQISPPLPDLYSMSSIDTTLIAYADLPPTYQRNVVMVVDSNGNRISGPRGGGYSSFRLFLNQISKKNLSESGDVYVVCVKGSKLYYQGIPSIAKPLTIHFYRLPVDMELFNSVPDGIPAHLQHRLIVHWVCGNFFGEGVEDGENSNKMGHDYHLNKFYTAMIDLVDFIGIDAEPTYYMGGSDIFNDGAVCD